MADISKIQVPNGAIYDIKDTVARDAFTNLTTATQIADGLMSKEDKIALDNLSVNAKSTLTIENQEVITVDDAYADVIEDLIVKIEPVVGDFVIGKNKFNPLTETEGYYISATGKPSSSADDSYSDFIPVIEGESYVISGYQTEIGAGQRATNKRIHGYNAIGSWQVQLGVTQLAQATLVNATEPVPWVVKVTIPTGVTQMRVSHRTQDSNIMVEVGTNKTEYESYLETRPLYQNTSVTLTINDNTNTTSYTENLSANPIWSGTVNFLTGEVIEEYGEIASYNGETLNGVWYSDRDVYSAGASPSLGAQVIYKLSSPITYSAQNYSLQTALGYNRLTLSSGLFSKFTYQSRTTSITALKVTSGSIIVGNTVITEGQLQQLLALISN